MFYGLAKLAFSTPTGNSNRRSQKVHHFRSYFLVRTNILDVRYPSARCSKSYSWCCWLTTRDQYWNHCWATNWNLKLPQFGGHLQLDSNEESILWRENTTLSEYGTSSALFDISQTPDFHSSNRASKQRMNIATLPSTWEFMDEFVLFDLDFSAYPVLSNGDYRDNSW